jgi:membrane-bound lytic murein transglycosylase B
MENMIFRKNFLVFLFSLSLLYTGVFLPVSRAQDDASSIQDDIASLQKKLQKEQKDMAALDSKLGGINRNLSVTEQAILQTEAAIKTTRDNLERKILEIQLLEEEINQKENALTDMLRELYSYGDNASVAYFFGTGDEFQSAFHVGDDLLPIGDRLDAAVQDIRVQKANLEQEKGALDSMKQEHEKLLAEKSRQKQTLIADKVNTQGDIEDQATTIKRLQKELSQLQSDLSKLTGQSYNAKDIKEAVNFASKETGVPKGFLMGVLKMETNLGANVGGCTYAEVEDGAMANYKAKKLGKTAWATFQRRRDLFKSITKELGIDYRKQKVSCNPKGYTGTGGAMGVAQFMPDTWNAYKSQVAKATGHDPPSPWSLTDGVMAMAKKLSMVPGVTDGNRSAWKKASALYLGTSYAPYINGILYWADHYKELL